MNACTIWSSLQPTLCICAMRSLAGLEKWHSNILQVATESLQPPHWHCRRAPTRRTSTGSSDAAACASCHKEVVKNFDSNPHSGARVPGGKGVTCESCHGPGKAHEEGGDVASIFDPATATAKDVDKKCQACHGGRHVNFERSSHGKGNVSCAGCHSVHAAVAPKHLLKLAQ